MSMTIRIHGLREAQKEFRDLGTTGIRAVGKKTLQEFFAELRQIVHSAWVAVKVTGGNFRGTYWPKLKPQYTRKLDGVEVPAWGGVPRFKGQFVKFGKGGKSTPGAKIGLGFHRTGARKISFKEGKSYDAGHHVERNKNWGGNVLGRRRPSGRPIKQGDTMMMDTQAMYRGTFTEPSYIDHRILRIEPSASGTGSIYSEAQNDQRMWANWIPDDETRLAARYQRNLEAEAAKRFDH